MISKTRIMDFVEIIDGKLMERVNLCVVNCLEKKG